MHVGHDVVVLVGIKASGSGGGKSTSGRYDAVRMMMAEIVEIRMYRRVCRVIFILSVSPCVWGVCMGVCGGVGTWERGSVEGWEGWE